MRPTRAPSQQPRSATNTMEDNDCTEKDRNLLCTRDWAAARCTQYCYVWTIQGLITVKGIARNVFYSYAQGRQNLAIACKPRFPPNAQIRDPGSVCSIQLPMIETNWRRTSHTTTKGNAVLSYYDFVTTWYQYTRESYTGDFWPQLPSTIRTHGQTN